jgi:hypothetical protein
MVSPHGRARLETDMRAHFNPTRMQSLAVLAGRLAQRLARQCPACGTPGFGRTGTRTGLLCEGCGTAAEMVVAEVFGCPACDYSEERHRFDGLPCAGAVLPGVQPMKSGRAAAIKPALTALSFFLRIHPGRGEGGRVASFFKRDRGHGGRSALSTGLGCSAWLRLEGSGQQFGE